MKNVLQTCPYDTVLIVGDFNTDPGRNNAQTASLTDLLERNSLICSWDLPCADKTTVHHKQCILTRLMIHKCPVLAILWYPVPIHIQLVVWLYWNIPHAPKTMGLFPICINFTLSAPRENEYYCNDNKCVAEKIAWHKVTNYTNYESLMSEMLSVNTVIGELSCLKGIPTTYAKKSPRLNVSIFYLKVTNNMANQNMKRKGLIPEVVFELGCIENYNSYIRKSKKFAYFCIFKKNWWSNCLITLK